MPRKNQGAEAFMQELISNTWANPFLPGTRGFTMEADEDGAKCWVEVDMRPWDDGILFSSIQTHLEGHECHEKGYATEIVERLLDMADRHGVPLYGSVEPFGRPPRMNKTQLKRWYKSLGFNVDRSGRLVYEPRGPAL